MTTWIWIKNKKVEAFQRGWDRRLLSS